MKKEVRNTNYKVTLSGDGGDESRHVEGYAALFDTKSDGLSFEEVIERGAMDGVIEKSDVFALLDHDTRRAYLPDGNERPALLSFQSTRRGLNTSLTLLTPRSVMS
jgi:phage head maturation protease